MTLFSLQDDDYWEIVQFHFDIAVSLVREIAHLMESVNYIC